MKYRIGTFWLAMGGTLLLSSCAQMPVKSQPDCPAEQELLNFNDFVYLLNHGEVSTITIFSGPIIQLDMADESIACMDKLMFEEIRKKKFVDLDPSNAFPKIIHKK